jgi:hypothetical protein
MSGKRIKIGARDTYVPPVVIERFDGPPFWACTFTALLNGANVGFLGNREASHAEVRRLARASGDADLRGGSRSSHMITAMRVRYGKRMFMEALPPRRVHERLSSGWAMVGAVTYGALPKTFRRHSPNFKKGHRITLIGWDHGSTWILDPMARKGSGYTGEPIKWSQFEDAWWSGEQLWFAEGMFRKPPRVKVRENVTRGRWSLPSGSRFVLRSGRNPRIIVRKFVTAETKSGRFDQRVDVILKDGSSMGEFIRVSGGNLDGMLIPITKRLVLNPRATGPAKQPAAPAPAANMQSPDFLAGRQKEHDAIKAHVGPAVLLPPRPK